MNQREIKLTHRTTWGFVTLKDWVVIAKNGYQGQTRHLSMFIIIASLIFN